MNRVKIKKGDGFCNGRFDLIQERRLEQAERYEKKKWEVGCWLEGRRWMTNIPCACGRDHCALEVQSILGTQRFCPHVWWGWVNLLADPEEVKMQPDLKNLPMEEWERWMAFYRESGEAALAELDKIAPHIAEAIREAQREEARKVLSRGRNLLRSDDEDLI